MFNVELLQKIARRGAKGMKLVPSSHKKCELGHTHFKIGDQRIREAKPVPDSLKK